LLGVNAPPFVRFPTKTQLGALFLLQPFAEAFRDSQEVFFASYARAHKKLSELGSKFEPDEGISM
jgi:hypothetical protein